MLPHVACKCPYVFSAPAELWIGWRLAPCHLHINTICHLQRGEQHFAQRRLTLWWNASYFPKVTEIGSGRDRLRTECSIIPEARCIILEFINAKEQVENWWSKWCLGADHRGAFITLKVMHLCMCVPKYR